MAWEDSSMLITVDELKTFMAHGGTDPTTNHDPYWESLIKRATREIETFIGRRLPTTEYWKWVNINYTNQYSFPEYPVKNFFGGWIGNNTAITWTNVHPKLLNSYIIVSTVDVRLVQVFTDNTPPTSDVFTFADNPNTATLVDTINNAAIVGWGMELTTNCECQRLMPGTYQTGSGGLPCALQPVPLLWNPNENILYTGGGWGAGWGWGGAWCNWGWSNNGFLTLIHYSAGYDSPEDIQDLKECCCQLAVYYNKPYGSSKAANYSTVEYNRVRQIMQPYKKMRI